MSLSPAIKNTLGWKISCHRGQRKMWEGELAEAVNNLIASRGKPLTVRDIVAWQQNQAIPNEAEFEALLCVLVHDNPHIPKSKKEVIITTFRQAYAQAQENGPLPGDHLGGLIIQYRADVGNEEGLAAKINALAHLKPDEGRVGAELIREIEHGKSLSQGLLRCIAVVLDAPELMQMSIRRAPTTNPSSHAKVIIDIMKSVWLGDRYHNRDIVSASNCCLIAYKLGLTSSNPKAGKANEVILKHFISNVINNSHPEKAIYDKSEQYKNILVKVLEHKNATAEQIQQFTEAYDALIVESKLAKAQIRPRGR